MKIDPDKSPSVEGVPTKVRYGVLGFVSVLSMITYLDRVAIASAAPFIVRDLGLTSVADLRWVFTAFAFAYAVFEVPSGWLGEVFGPQLVLIRIVAWWSFVLFGTAGIIWCLFFRPMVSQSTGGKGHCQSCRINSDTGGRRRIARCNQSGAVVAHFAQQQPFARILDNAMWPSWGE